MLKGRKSQSWAVVKRSEMRSVVGLYKKGFGRATIARELGISERRIRTILAHARVKLRKRGHHWDVSDDYRSKILVGYKKLPIGVAPRNAVLGSYINTAKRKGVAWKLNDAEFDQRIFGNCAYCGSPASLGSLYSFAHRHHPENFIFYNGIDRVDSAGGYTPENAVSCCKTCNRAKSNLSLSDFKNWIARLMIFQKGLA